MSSLLSVLGGTFTALAAVVASYAALKARQVDQKTQTRQETQQALDAQSALLNRYEKRIGWLETEYHKIQVTAEDALAARNEMIHAHQRCESDLAAVSDRLRIAETRIMEIGG